jgi:hypothetical protein
MQRPWLKTLAAALVATALFAVTPARAASPFVGNWKLLDVSSGNEVALVLVQIEEKDGKLQGKALASPLINNSASVENVKGDDKMIEFDVKFSGGTFHVKGHPVKGKGVLGAINFNNRLILTQLTKTDDTELKREDAQNQTAEGQAVAKARLIRDAKEQQAALKEILEKHGDTPAAYVAAQLLLQNLVKEGAKDDELRATVEQFVKSGANFGAEVEKNTVLTACQALARGEKVSPVAVEFARKAEMALTKDDTTAHSSAVLKALATALKKTGKEDEAKQLQPRIDKLEAVLDAEFEKNAVPFKPGEYKGRKGDNLRVAVVELFTGAYCPPCVAADVAFDAALETYKPKDVIFLQYHTHIPAPDRLTNADTETRLKYYEKEVRGVPTAFLNGKATKPLGGGKANGEGSYTSLRGEIDEALDKETTASLKLTAERKGDKIDINAEVTGLKDPGENVKLRLVLIEEVARYPGGNGQRLHHHVVRALPGGADGLVLKEAKAKQSVKIDLAELKKSLDEYMTKYNEGPRKFLDDEYPLNIKHLKVVALIQDDSSKEILQAVQIDVPDAK